MPILATDHVNERGYPTTEGAKLASALIALYPSGWVDKQVVLNLPPAMLIGVFFNAFLQRVHDERPDLLEQARQTSFQVQFPFQMKLVATWVTGFKPVKPSQPNA